MKAAIYRAYGPPGVVRVEDVTRPEPRDNEVLIRVQASTVSSADIRMRSLKLPPGFAPFARPALGLLGPRKPILGTELSGVIEAVGSRVTRFQVGDRVFAFPGIDLGAHAELRAMPEEGRIAPMPAGLTFAQAAALCFGGTTALHFLQDKAQLQPGQRVLVIGASGAVGSAAVQIARALGAEVTGVSSAANAAQVLALGAADVIDYTRQTPGADGRRWHAVLDAVGVLSNAAGLRLLEPGGALLPIVAGLGQLLSAPFTRKPEGRRIFAGPAEERVEHLAILAALAERGAFVPLIDRAYPLDDIAQAHAYVDQGRKRGSVVITLPAAA